MNQASYNGSGATGAGIGLRSPHVARVIADRPAVGFLEVHAENYLFGGRTKAVLDQVRREGPVSVHGVGLSLGSAEGVDPSHLERLAALVDWIEPVAVSEHLTWSVNQGRYLNDLVPLPLTEEALDVVVANVLRVEDRLRRPILIENPSAYLRFHSEALDEAEFLTELARRTGCGLLCDVNNIYVTTHNLGGDPFAWLQGLPADRVGEIHLAGHAINEVDGGIILIDDHGSRVSPPVWALYEAAVRLFPQALALVEWDRDIPDLDVLVAEAAEADRRRHVILAGSARDAVAA